MNRSKGTHESGGSPTPAFPTEPSSYGLLGQIGAGVSGVVYKATCLPLGSSVVAIKSIDLDRTRANLEHIRLEAKSMSLLSHPNILTAHCSFTVGTHLWVVMPFMSGGSLHSIIASSFPSGLPEPSIAVILKETLQALHYLHSQGLLHRDIKAGNILINSDGSVKLADFGVSASIYEPSSSSSSSTFSCSSLFSDLAGTPYWMAPEVIQSHYGYGFKADIWSLGITAMELAHGRPPLSHIPPMKSLLMRITNHLRLNSEEKGSKKKFSKQFQDLVASCLVGDPSKRPTAEKLLKHPFFKNCKSQDYLVRHVLQGLPSVEERFKESAARVGEEEEGEGEEDLVLTKNRRISGWNFNEKVLELDPVFPTDQEGGKVYSPFEADPSVSSTQSLSYALSVAENDEMGNTEDTFDGEPLPPLPFQMDELSIKAQECPSVSDQTCMETVVPGLVSSTQSLSYASSVGENDEMGNTEDPFDGEALPPPPFQMVELGIRAQEGPSVSDRTCMETVVPGLVSLMGSLNEQKEIVKMALATCGIEDESLDVENIGDVEARLVEVVNSLRAKAERLEAELEEEKKIVAALEEENEQLKKSISNFKI